MKKTILFKAMTFFVAMAASVSLVSCGGDDDDDDIPVDPAAIKAISVGYAVDTTEDFFEFYDISANYGFDSGAGTTETLAFPGWSVSATYDQSVILPSSVFCRIVATPKAVTPAIDPDKVYTFKAEYVMNVQGLRNDDQTTLLNYRASSHPSVTMKGDKVQLYLDKGEVVVVDYHYDFE